jgi:hypothetical protein
VNAFDLFSDLIAPSAGEESPDPRHSESRVVARESPESPLSPLDGATTSPSHHGQQVSRQCRTSPAPAATRTAPRSADALEALVRRICAAHVFSSTAFDVALADALRNPNDGWSCFMTLTQEIEEVTRH